MKKLLLILFCVFSLSEVQAQMQPFLLLQKPGNIKKRIRYYPGDAIVFKLAGKGRFEKGFIGGFSDTSIVLDTGADIPLSQIVKIKEEDSRGAFRAIGISALSSIPVFFLFSTANNLFNTQKRPLIDQEVYVLSGAFGAIGLISFAIPDKRYNVKNRWHLSVVRM